MEVIEGLVRGRELEHLVRPDQVERVQAEAVPHPAIFAYVEEVEDASLVAGTNSVSTLDLS